MDDQLRDLLKSLKAAEDVLQADGAKHAEPEPEPAVEAEHGDRQGERKIALGDVAKAHKDYEREPLDRK